MDFISIDAEKLKENLGFAKSLSGGVLIGIVATVGGSFVLWFALYGLYLIWTINWMFIVIPIAILIVLFILSCTLFDGVFTFFPQPKNHE